MEPIEILENINLVPEPLKAYLVQYYKGGLTQKELANRFKVSVYRVQVNLSKGRYIIRKALSEGEYFKERKKYRTDMLIS